MAHHGVPVFGARGNGRGPIGEQLLDRGVRLTPAEVSAQLAAAHATQAAVAEVVAFDFSQTEAADLTAEQAV